MDKNKLKQYVETCIQRSGSAAEIARKCGISGTALSQFRSGKYGANDDSLAQTIATGLRYKENDWVVVENVTSYKQIALTFLSAKQEQLWMAISNKAGSGKTKTLEDLYLRSADDSVTYIQCREWSARQFLLELTEITVGKSKNKQYRTIDTLIDILISYFNDKSFKKPILIIDEADKLKPAALRTLIPLHNETEYRLGALLAGTENLEKEIKRGVNSEKKGYDEIDSRLGRTFIHLSGATQSEVIAICAANGVSDKNDQDDIWDQVDKELKQINKKKDKKVLYTEDFRRLMRLIKAKRVEERLRKGVQV